MMSEFTRDIQEKLAEPFADDEIKWLPKITTKKGPNNTRVNIERNGQRVAGCMAHIDARQVMQRLDDVVGAGGWSDEYQVSAVGRGVECRLTVLGVSKVDVGIPSDTEPEKGAYSDALKRAAVKFGIGRHLYDIDTQWLPFDGWKITKPQQAPKMQAQQPVTEEPNGNGTEQAPQLITDKQRRQLHAVGTKCYGDEWDDKKVAFSAAFHVKSSNDWTTEQATKIIDGMNKIISEREPQEPLFAE